MASMHYLRTALCRILHRRLKQHFLLHCLIPLSLRMPSERSNLNYQCDRFLRHQYFILNAHGINTKKGTTVFFIRKPTNVTLKVVCSCARQKQEIILLPHGTFCHFQKRFTIIGQQAIQFFEGFTALHQQSNE